MRNCPISGAAWFQELHLQLPPDEPGLELLSFSDSSLVSYKTEELIQVFEKSS